MPEPGVPFIRIEGADYNIRPEHSFFLLWPHIIGIAKHNLTERKVAIIRDVWDALSEEDRSSAGQFLEQVLQARVTEYEAPVDTLKVLGWFDMTEDLRNCIAVAVSTAAFCVFQELASDSSLMPDEAPKLYKDLLTVMQNLTIMTAVLSDYSEDSERTAYSSGLLNATMDTDLALEALVAAEDKENSKRVAKAYFEGRYKATCDLIDDDMRLD